jgi:hypothetical protein
VRVRHGWSGEVGPNQWAKLDVELEEDDLRRILVPQGIEPANVSVGVAYLLLDIEAELSLTHKLVNKYGMKADARLAELREARNKLIMGLK